MSRGWEGGNGKCGARVRSRMLSFATVRMRLCLFSGDPHLVHQHVSHGLGAHRQYVFPHLRHLSRGSEKLSAEPCNAPWIAEKCAALSSWRSGSHHDLSHDGGSKSSCTVGIRRDRRACEDWILSGGEAGCRSVCVCVWGGGGGGGGYRGM